MSKINFLFSYFFLHNQESDDTSDNNSADESTKLLNNNDSSQLIKNEQSSKSLPSKLTQQLSEKEGDHQKVPVGATTTSKTKGPQIPIIVTPPDGDDPKSQGLFYIGKRNFSCVITQNT